MDSEALGVVGSLYAAATGEEDWDECLCRLADFCGARNAALVRADLRAGKSSVIAPRADPAVIAAYTGRWWVEDPTARATADAPVGQITSLADTGHELFHKSLFHNEFWRHSGLGAERLAVNLSLGRARFASCVLQTPAMRDELDARARRRFASLVPHLVRAEAIHTRLHRPRMANAALSAVITDRQGAPAPPRSRSRAALYAALTADIAANLDDCDLSLAWLAGRHGITPRRIRDIFYARNTSFTDYLLTARLDRAGDMLRDGALAQVNVATIALDCGFGDISWFHHAFRRRFGQTPAEMRRQAGA